LEALLAHSLLHYLQIEITELVPNILTQLGPESLATLRKLAEAYQAQHKAQMGEDGDVPELVENL
jgi:nascent polypeptide-associated complex subunit beta